MSNHMFVLVCIRWFLSNKSHRTVSVEVIEMNTKPWVRYCSISTCGNFKGTTDKNVPVFR